MMIRMGFWAALALVAAGPVAAQSASPAPQSVGQADREARLRTALETMNTGKPAEAGTLLASLLAEYETLYVGEKGRIYCAHNPREAILYASEAEAAKTGSTVIDTGWCTALWARGFALIDLQQVDAAVPFLERAVAMSPSHPHYLSELGYAYQVQKKWQLSYDTYARAAAGAELEKGDQRTKSLRRAWFGMGYNLIELGRLDDAEKILVKCLELTPDDDKVKRELQYVRDERARKS